MSMVQKKKIITVAMTGLLVSSPAAFAGFQVNQAVAAVAAPDPKPASDFVVVKQAERMFGDFVVAKQSAPVQVLARFETHERTGNLPDPNVMWRLMQAAVNGDRIVLSGVSGVSNAKERERYANNYANKLRNSLLAVGFPAGTVVVAEDADHFGKRGGVTIEIIKGNLQ